MVVKRAITLVIAVLLAPWACDLDVKNTDFDGGVEQASGFIWSWEVTDKANSTIIGCDGVGAQLVRVTVVDSAQGQHVFMWECSSGNGSTDRVMAAGDATVTADLLVRGKIVSSLTSTKLFRRGSSSNNLGNLLFGVEEFDPWDGADSSVRWQWGFGLEDTWQYPTSLDCDAAGFEKALLWLWDPGTQSWRRDEGWGEMVCHLVDHGGGHGAWAGLYYEDLVSAGTYKFMVGFYQSATTFDELGGICDRLVDYLTCGASTDGKTGEVSPDSLTEHGYNDLGLSLLDTSTHQEGVLVIDLDWGSSSGQSPCDEAGVDRMGFTLMSGDLVVASKALDPGLGCRDRLVFPSATVFSEGYELIVMAADHDDVISWYAHCKGLDPEQQVTQEEAQGWRCSVSNVLWY